MEIANKKIQLKVMTDEDIITEYGVSKPFINRFSAELGCYFHRPRKFLRSNVEAFFEAKAKEAMTKKRGQRIVDKEVVVNLLKDVCREHEQKYRRKVGS